MPHFDAKFTTRVTLFSSKREVVPPMRAPEIVKRDLWFVTSFSLPFLKINFSSNPPNNFIIINSNHRGFGVFGVLGFWANITKLRDCRTDLGQHWGDLGQHWVNICGFWANITKLSKMASTDS